MRAAYGRTLIGEGAMEAQRRYYGRAMPARAPGEAMELGPDELQFIGERDSFYLGTISESGWPYVQHRGGPKGFLKAIGPATLAFADLQGNRQMISTAAVGANGKVSLFLMDYVARERLKLIGRARVIDAREADSSLIAATPDGRRAERFFVIEVVGFDWNCPKYITPRYTAEQVEAAMAGLRRQIVELEGKLAGRSVTGL